MRIQIKKIVMSDEEIISDKDTHCQNTAVETFMATNVLPFLVTEGQESQIDISCLESKMKMAGLLFVGERGKRVPRTNQPLDRIFSLFNQM